MSNSYTRDERPADRVVDRTVVVNSGATRSGGSGWFLAGILVVALVIGAFFFFGGSLGGSGGSSAGGDTNITVNTPDIKVPDVNVQTPSVPASGSSSAPAN